MKRLLVLVGAVSILAGGPAFAQSAEEAVKEGLDAWEAVFNAGDGKALADLYTEDAVLLPPGAERIEGRGKIAEFWQGAIDAGLEDPDLEAVEVVESGDLGRPPQSRR
jgi:ketosteroid isomerase-like protein